MARWKTTKLANTNLPANETLTWKIKFISPLFGGGVKTKETEDTEDKRHPMDEITPVRVSSIRGQLRFWWRAAIGSGMGNLENMRKREAYLFGDTKHRAAVEISLTAVDQILREQIEEEIFTWNSNGKNTYPKQSGYGYACFSLNKTSRDEIQNNTTLGKIFDVKNRTFTLQIKINSWLEKDKKNDEEENQNEQILQQKKAKDKKEILLTVRSWLAFGGLGGRTRRGFGALVELDQNGNEKTPNIESLLNEITQNTQNVTYVHGVPSIIGLSEKNHDYGIIRCTHEQLLKKFQSFRQGNIGRNPNSAYATNHPGQSYWPEADAIRIWKKQYLKEKDEIGREHNHNPGKHLSETLNGAPGGKMPRGLFGMPLGFKFKDGGPNRNKDPQKTMLYPKYKGTVCDRLASPLILKPICDNQCVALILKDPSRNEIRGQLQNDEPNDKTMVDGADDIVLTLQDGEKNWAHSPLTNAQGDASLKTLFLKLLINNEQNNQQN